MANNTAPLPIGNILRGVGVDYGLDLANECKSGTILPRASGGSGVSLAAPVDSLTAHAGGGQGSALALTGAINRITTVATAGDSVVLPASVAAAEVIVINAGANPCQVYGAGTDTINGVATATGVSQQPNSAVLYVCVTAGSWFAVNIGIGFSGQLFAELAVDSLTAHAGGGQGSALALTAQQAE